LCKGIILKGVVNVKFKVTQKGLANAEQVHESNVKKGRRSKVKGSNFERDVAKKFKSVYKEDLTRTPQSGGFSKKSEKADDFRGDIVCLNPDVDMQVHVECKNAKTWSLPKWLEQAENDCPKGKVPVVVFHKHGTSKDYIALSLEDFFSLVPKEAIFKEVK
jgi:hypothetical protein